MGPHSRQQSIQQSTNIICDGSASLKRENNLFNTINMTIIAHRVDDDVRRRRCNDGTMGTVQPAGQIQQCRCRVDARMCVGIEGRQGGKGGRARRRCIFAHAHPAIGVTDFFLRHDVGGSTHNTTAVITIDPLARLIFILGSAKGYLTEANINT